MAGRDGRFSRDRERQTGDSGIDWGGIATGLVVGGAAAAAAYSWWSSGSTGSTKTAGPKVCLDDDKDDEEEMVIIANACPDRAGGIIKFQIKGQKYVWHYSVDWRRLGYSSHPHEQEPSDMEIANALLATLIAREALNGFDRGVNVTIKLDNNVIEEHHHPIWSEIEGILEQVTTVKEDKRSSSDMKNADTLSRGLWREWQAGQLRDGTPYNDRQGVEKNDEAQDYLPELEKLLRRRGKHPRGRGAQATTGITLNSGWF